MPSRIRKLASETAVYGLSSILARAVNFLLFPFYSQVFSPDEYAPVIVLYAAFVFLNILYQYGMESAYMKFAAAARDASTDGDRSSGSDRVPDGDRATDVFSTAFWSLAGTSAVFSALLWFGRDGVGPAIGLAESFTSLLGYAAAILLLDTLIVVPFAELRLAGRPWYFAFVRSMNVGVNVGLNLWLILGRGMGIEAVLISNVAASGVELALLSPVIRQSLRLRFDSASWRPMMRFALPFLPGGLGYAITERINIFFLERMPADRAIELYGASMPAETLARAAAGNPAAATDFVVGTYGGMVKLAIFMALGAQMFRFAWQPFFLKHAKDEDAPQLFARVFLILTAGLGAVLLATSFFAAELVALPLPGGRRLIAESYWIGLSIVPVALAGYAFQAWYYHFSAGAYLTNTTRYFVPCTLAGSAVALAVNAAFVPAYGMIAAAWATSGAYATMSLALVALVNRQYPVPYPWRRISALVLIAGALMAAWAWIPGVASWPVELGLCLAYGVAAWRVSADRS